MKRGDLVMVNTENRYDSDGYPGQFSIYDYVNEDRTSQVYAGSIRTDELCLILDSTHSDIQIIGSESGTIGWTLKLYFEVVHETG